MSVKSPLSRGEIFHYLPPRWVGLEPRSYASSINRMAVAITRRDSRRGGIYRVKEAMDAIHATFQASSGCDPYDGLPLEGSLLTASCLPCGRRDDAPRLRRQPAIVACVEQPVCRFELVSRQTAQAKGGLTASDYIAHCRAVVSTTAEAPR